MEDTEGSSSFDDIEQQNSNFSKKSAYDLDDISKQPSRNSNEEMSNYSKNSRTSRTSRSSASNSLSMESRNRWKVDEDSENLRECEPSIEYSDRDLKRMMKEMSNVPLKENIRRDFNKPTEEQKANTMIPITKDVPSSTPPLPNNQWKSSNNQPSYPNSSPNTIRQRSNNFSPGAPSDEGGFIVRSPGPVFGFRKENSSPRKTPKSKRSPFKNKGTKAAASVPTANQPPRYNEELIQKCVVDLTESFSHKEPSHQNVHYR